MKKLLHSFFWREPGFPASFALLDRKELELCLGISTVFQDAGLNDFFPDAYQNMGCNFTAGRKGCVVIAG